MSSVRDIENAGGNGVPPYTQVQGSGLAGEIHFERFEKGAPYYLMNGVFIFISLFMTVLGSIYISNGDLHGIFLYLFALFGVFVLIYTQPKGCAVLPTALCLVMRNGNTSIPYDAIVSVEHQRNSMCYSTCSIARGGMITAITDLLVFRTSMDSCSTRYYFNPINTPAFLGVLRHRTPLGPRIVTK